MPVRKTVHCTFLLAVAMAVRKTVHCTFLLAVAMSVRKTVHCTFLLAVAMPVRKTVHCTFLLAVAMPVRKTVHCTFLLPVAMPVRKTFTIDVRQIGSCRGTMWPQAVFSSLVYLELMEIILYLWCNWILQQSTIWSNIAVASTVNWMARTVWCDWAVYETAAVRFLRIALPKLNIWTNADDFSVIVGAR